MSRIEDIFDEILDRRNSLTLTQASMRDEIVVIRGMCFMSFVVKILFEFVILL